MSGDDATARRSATEVELGQVARHVAAGLQEFLDNFTVKHDWHPVRFTLLLAEPGGPGKAVLYVSTFERAGMLTTLRELLNEFEGGRRRD